MRSCAADMPTGDSNSSRWVGGVYVGDVLAEKGTRARAYACIGDYVMQSTASTMQNADQCKGFG